MATLLLAGLGSAIGASVGGSLLGVSAVAIGQAVGATIGQAIDNSLLAGSSSTSIEGPRLDRLEVMTSKEGAGMPYIDGRMQIGGEVIWATRLEEVVNTTTEQVGGKGGGSTVTSTEYSYFANFAIAVGEGPVAHFGRIWADGKPLDISELTVRFYKGSEDQMPDPYIEAKEGTAPAYRGIAYVVFERFPVANFGNRVPQIKIEVWGNSGEVENLIKGVDLIPGSTEFGYLPRPVRRVEKDSNGKIINEYPENAHRHKDISDWQLSLDLLDGTLPECETVSLVVGWFGNDLRAGSCEIAPRVEVGQKDTDPVTWSAGGLSRAQAVVVTEKDGKPAFGSTPADISVVEAIEDLKARGKRVVLYPFIMMDIEDGSTLPDPSGTGTQAAYPWRGRIRATDGAAVAGEVSAFVGTAAASDFTVTGKDVSYTGPNEWSYRRFILHLANLAKAAGGVDAFLIGSEMVGMTTSTEAASGVYPFVDALVDLASDVSGVLPSSSISYAADWSEYHSHRPSSGDVFFNMDSLWSSAAIDFIGIDNYLPLSDWREGSEHIDYDAAQGHTSIYVLDYLKSNIEGGEYFDWYYASDADREAQIRSPISDGAYGEDWVFRNKAIRDWHGNAHHDRPAGVRDASATGWVSGSKPIWFTEIGCPCVDKGSNQPNVFFAKGSSESALPYYSDGVRDDFMSRQFLRATLEWWRDNGGAIVSIDNIQVWSWDARPWPEFPLQSGVWSDGPDWYLGHWLNGRAGCAPAAECIERRLIDAHGFPSADVDVSRCYGQADGYVLPGPSGFRSWLQPWETVLRIDAVEDRSILRFQSRLAAVPVAHITPGDMIDDGSEGQFLATRGALEDVARVAVLTFPDGTRDYERVPARAAIEVGREEGVAHAETPLVLDYDRGTMAAEGMIRTAAEGRERLAFVLPPSRREVKIGSLVTAEIIEGEPRVYLVDRATTGEGIAVELSSYSPGAFAPVSTGRRIAPSFVTMGSSSVLIEFLDLPLLLDTGFDDWAGYAAAHAKPWPGGADLYRSIDAETGFSLNKQVGSRATMGETVSSLEPGSHSTWSGEVLEVRLYSGGFVTRPELDVLEGSNSLAVEHSPGQWEILQFRDAELIAADTWRLTPLLRGLRGTEFVRGATALAAGAKVVLLNQAIFPVEMDPTDIDRAFWWKFGPSGSDPDGDGFSTASHTFNGAGRRPFTVAHLHAGKGASATDLSWIRRTRIEGDPWPEDGGDVPLGEVSERYLVEIGPDGSPVRSVEVASPAFEYTDAMKATDGISAPFDVRVAQVSEAYGPGPFLTITVPA